MTQSEMKFTGALLGTGVVQPHQSYSKGGRIEVLCRQVPGQGAAVLDMLTALLKKADEVKIIMHACKRFVLKDGVMVFGWNFAVEAKNTKELQAAIAKLAPELEKVKPCLSQLDPEPVPVNMRSPSRPEEQEVDEEEQPPPPPRKSEYKTDAQVMRKMGIIKDSKAGVLGRLEPMGGTKTHYEVGKKLKGPRISVISAQRDDDTGIPTIISEMPLPHVSKEMNIPRFIGDKGAQYMGKAKVGAITNQNRRSRNG